MLQVLELRGSERLKGAALSAAEEVEPRLRQAVARQRPQRRLLPRREAVRPHRGQRPRLRQTP